jgi:hypothetical protein
MARPPGIDGSNRICGSAWRTTMRDASSACLYGSEKTVNKLILARLQHNGNEKPIPNVSYVLDA